MPGSTIRTVDDAICEGLNALLSRDGAVRHHLLHFFSCHVEMVSEDFQPSHATIRQSIKRLTSDLALCRSLPQFTGHTT